MRGIMFGLVVLAAAGCQPAPADGDTERGARLLVQYQCGACHTIPGVPGARGPLGPTLQGFGRRAYIAGQLPNDEPTLLRWIIDPRSLLPATPMPAMGANEADARAMAAYLLSLK